MKTSEKSPSNLALLIDTASEQSQSSLLDLKRGEILAKQLLESRSLSENLLVEIDKLLKANDFDKSDLAAVFVHLGPGSYTSVRIGVTTANFLALALDIPIYPLDPAQLPTQTSVQDFKYNSPLNPIYLSPPKITLKRTGRE